MRGRLGLSFLPSAGKPPLLFSSIALPFGDLKLLCGSRHYIVIQFFICSITCPLCIVNNRAYFFSVKM